MTDLQKDQQNDQSETAARPPRKGQLVTFRVEDSYTGWVDGSAVVVAVEGDVLTLRPLSAETRIVDVNAEGVQVAVVAADAVPGTYTPDVAEAD